MLQSFFTSVSSVLVILVLTATGYFLGAAGWIKKEHKDCLSKILIDVFVPCNCLYGMLTHLDRDMLLASGIYLLIPLAATLVNYPLGFLAAKLLRLPHRHVGIFILLTATSNGLVVGLPMCSELLGESTTPYVMLYYIVSHTMLYVVSVGIARTTMSEGKEKLNIGKTLLDVLKSPAVIAVLLGIVLLLFGVKLPAPAMNYLKYMSGAVVPLAIILSGYVIYSIGFKSMRLNRETVGVLIFRFLIAPAIAWGFCLLFGAEGLGLKVNLILAAMPSVAISVVTAARYGNQDDEMFASQGFAWTNLAVFAVTPVLMLLI